MGCRLDGMEKRHQLGQNQWGAALLVCTCGAEMSLGGFVLSCPAGTGRGAAGRGEGGGGRGVALLLQMVHTKPAPVGLSLALV